MSKNQGNAMEVPGLLGAVGAGRWPAGFVAWRLRPCAGWATRPRRRRRMIRAGARAGRRARRSVMIRCFARAERVPCAGPGRRFADASFMSSGASGGEKEGAGSYGR